MRIDTYHIDTRSYRGNTDVRLLPEANSILELTNGNRVRIVTIAVITRKGKGGGRAEARVSDIIGK